MNEASKNLLGTTVKEWTKFVAEVDKMKSAAHEITDLAQKAIAEQLAFLKSQNVDADGSNPVSMTLLGAPVIVEPVIEATFPTVKASVLLKCGGAARSIIINPNLSISAGGSPFMFEQLKKGVPDSFVTNAAEFVRDAFLNVARNAFAAKDQAAGQADQTAGKQ